MGMAGQGREGRDLLRRLEGYCGYQRSITAESGRRGLKGNVILSKAGGGGFLWTAKANPGAASLSRLWADVSGFSL